MQNKRPTLRTVYGIIIVLSLIGIAIVVRRSFKVIPILMNDYSAPAPQSNANLRELAKMDDIFAHYPLLTLIHIVFGLTFLLLTPFQFSEKIRKNNLHFHRMSGKIILISGCITGITAFVMSIFMPSIGGVNQAAATFLFSIFFLIALMKGYQNIRKRNIAFHREWMIRAYAIGLAIATIRPIVGVFFATRPFSKLTPYEFFGTAFWIGFVLHITIAEIWIHRTRAA